MAYVLQMHVYSGSPMSPSGGVVQVYSSATGLPAQLWGDRDEEILLSSHEISVSSGFFRCYVAAGRYDVKAVDFGSGVGRWFRDIEIGDYSAAKHALQYSIFGKVSGGLSTAQATVNVYNASDNSAALLYSDIDGTAWPALTLIALFGYFRVYVDAGLYHIKFSSAGREFWVRNVMAGRPTDQRRSLYNALMSGSPAVGMRNASVRVVDSDTQENAAIYSDFALESPRENPFPAADFYHVYAGLGRYDVSVIDGESEVLRYNDLELGGVPDYGGQSWGPVGPAGLNSGSGTANAVSAIASDGAETWVVGFVGGWASISTDGGLTFSGLTRGLNSGSTTDTINSIEWGDGVWVAGMNAGWASYSYNGTDWFPLPRWLNSGGSLSSSSVASIRFYGGIFVACVAGAGFAVSSDGISWSAVYSDEPYTEVAGSAAGWVARAGSWDCHTATPSASWPARRYRLDLGVSMGASGGLDISDAGVVIASSADSRFFMSVDSGSTYVEIASGLGGTTSTQKGPVVWAGGNTWIASHSFYSMITTDGTTWAQLPDHLNMASTSNPNYISALATNKSGVCLAGGVEGRLSRSPPLP